MEIRSPALDRVQQDFVDEAHHRRVVNLRAFGDRFLLRADFQIVQIFEV